MHTKLVYEAVYTMLIQANTKLDIAYYNKIKNYDSKIKNQILKNAYLANVHKRPLCQDTGIVAVFLEVGQDEAFEGDFIYDVINKAVEDCYKNNFYRKSVVKDALYDRTNTKTNTPCVIHTSYKKGGGVNILIGIKGGGAENMTRLKMLNPSCGLDDIYDFIQEVLDEAKDNACPPMTVGVGVGGTAEIAAISAKRALFEGKILDKKFENVIETRIITNPAHIASLPVCVNLNCHSLRSAKCEITENAIKYDFKDYTPVDVELKCGTKKVLANDKKALDSLNAGDEVLLSGKIYTARDMAHKRIVETIKNNGILPFDLKDAVIFYAGPCPKKEGEIIGPIGPTTSKRMDKFAPLLYEKGVIATIGKGQRTLNGGNRLYFKAIGGVAMLYRQTVKSAKLIAYEDLGAEGIFELEVVDMPLIADRI